MRRTSKEVRNRITPYHEMPGRMHSIKGLLPLFYEALHFVLEISDVIVAQN